MLDLTDEQIDEAAFNEAFIAVFGVGRPKAETVDEPCPECDGLGNCQNCRGEDDAEDCEYCRGTGECQSCDGTCVAPATDLSRAWEAASGEGQVVS